mmetsp:Transcript_129648/g.223937  ORF Transcript_129648/g.223937 Transcript_129648/m.223937 type:complete len:794 (-) Transcript_129648:272-2653(-)
MALQSPAAQQLYQQRKAVNFPPRTNPRVALSAPATGFTRPTKLTCAGASTVASVPDVSAGVSATVTYAHRPSPLLVSHDSKPSKPFIVGECIQWWSASHRVFFPTRIAAVNAADGSVQVECEPGLWVDSGQQALKIKRNSDAPFFVGEAISFWSTSNKTFFPTKVTNVNIENGLVQVECKPGIWFDRNEQTLRIVRHHHFDKADTKNVSDLDVAARGYFNYLQTAVSPGGEMMLAQLMNQDLQSFDKDNDGRLSKSEFIDLYRHLCSRLRMHPDEQKIAALVRGHTATPGILSDAEFRDSYLRLIRLMLSSFKVLGKDDLIQAARVAKQNFHAKYELGKRLAAGVQGVTYLATRRGVNPPQTVVVKKPNAVNDTEDFDLLKDKAHPNVVKVFEIFQTPHETFVVMEHCPGGDLFGGVQYCFANFGRVTTNWLANIMQQSMRGVKYLHSAFQQCHNDLKPENILLDRKPASITDCPRVMIADFGCAKGVNVASSGDPRYQPPERWIGGAAGNGSTPGTYACDVWALGVILFELMSGGMLIFTNHRNICGFNAWKTAMGGELFRRFQQGMLTPGFEPTWTQIQSSGCAMPLCKAMLTRDITKRITLDDALAHPWFNIIAEEPVELEVGVSQHLRKRATLCSLKVALLNLVAQKLQNASLETYHKVWKQFDKDENGVLTIDEFDEMLQSPALGLDAATAVELHSMADIDGNGNVDFNEFVALMFDPQTMTPAELEQTFKSMFNDLVGTKSELSQEELAAAFPAQANTLIPQLFQNMDTDGNGKVSFSEFSEFLSTM